jgi:hypothetical protein
MKTFEIEKYDSLKITGKGTVFVIHKDDHEFVHDISRGDTIKTLPTNQIYGVVAIEMFRNTFGVGKNVGVLVKEIDEEPPKKRLEKLEALSFADLKALQDECEDKLAYYQRRFPEDKKKHQNIYKEQYDLWLEWYSLKTAVDFVIDEFVKKLK